MGFARGVRNKLFIWLKFTMYVYIDIETVPMHATLDELDPIGLAIWESKYSKEVQDFLLLTPKNLSIAKQEHWMNKAGLIAEFGKIICISMWYNSPEWFRKKSYCFLDEKVTMAAWWEDMQKLWDVTFVWWNLKNFDLPWLAKKMLKHRVCVPALPKTLDNRWKKPREVNAIDLMDEYKLWGSIHASLGVVARYLLGLWAKEEMSWDRVAAVWYGLWNLPEKIEKITKYCESDVETTFKIHNYMSQ